MTTRVAEAPTRAVFVYDADLATYQLSASHPFKPVRLELSRSLIRESGLLGKDQEIGVMPLNPERLLDIHSEAYVDSVMKASAGKAGSDLQAYGLGTPDNPVFAGMHELVLQVSAATVTAVDAVAAGRAERALNLAGGLHHAHYDLASGFCIYNDLALGIEHAVRRYGFRVAYVDLDAHHGDGVQKLFYERDDVLTVSLHESGRFLFPGTGYTYEVGKGAGRGHSINLPLEPYTEDASFLESFRAVVPEALRHFQPDLIVLQAGADMHRNDPLAHLSLSTGAMFEAYREMSRLADELAGGRLVATGGGGYDPYVTVPRAWGLLWAALNRITPPERIPESWRTGWQGESPQPLPTAMFDETRSWRPSPRREAISQQNRANVAKLQRTLKPLLR